MVVLTVWNIARSYKFYDLQLLCSLWNIMTHITYHVARRPIYIKVVHSKLAPSFILIICNTTLCNVYVLELIALLNHISHNSIEQKSIILQAIYSVTARFIDFTPSVIYCMIFAMCITTGIKASVVYCTHKEHIDVMLLK